MILIINFTFFALINYFRYSKKADSSAQITAHKKKANLNI